ncbi:hypothetical protein BDV96DRAFT_653269 [Lophiotrema nucula]|uniref:F-box domain-containing protein n=1 Tax=Lophiotrema nucula TaxID=690887 RepID=A0A6A5YN02_9PLEO|nr:hypothetical protein BDV96DRAFT_653269 [Lophiotrema nucula]
MLLVELPPELLSTVASCLSQADLLNVSLVCKHLSEATEPELFREYSTTSKSHPNYLSFVKRLLQKPDLQKSVHFLEFKAFYGLTRLDTCIHDDCTKPCDVGFESVEPTREEYEMLTEAARAKGVINSIFPYTETFELVEQMRDWLKRTSRYPLLESVYDADLGSIDTEPVPYDWKFCQLLRAGIDEAYGLLIVCLLPNIRDLCLYGVTRDLEFSSQGARWGKNKALRRINVYGDAEYPIPLPHIKGLLQIGCVKQLSLSAAQATPSMLPDSPSTIYP